MLGQAGKLWVRPGTREDLGISGGDHSPALSFKRTRDHRCSTSCLARRDRGVDELNEIVGKAYRYLLAHTIMVANRYQI